MLGKISALKDKLSGYVDAAQDKVVDLLVTSLHPKVHQVIDSRVDGFRDSTLEAIPRQCEDGLKAEAESSTVAWLLDKVLGDSTDELVDKLLSQFKPGIVSATDGLSATAAEQIMAKLKDWLDGDDDEIGGGVAGAAQAADDAAPPAAEMEQLTVTEESRGLDLSAGDDAAAPEAAYEAEAEAAVASSSSRSVSRSALSAAAALAGGLVGLDGQLPKFEAAARELVHPLFEKLKTEVWELVPAALQESLSELVADKDDDDVAEAEVDAHESRGLTSWMSKVSTKLTGKAGDIVQKVAALTLEAIDGPMQELINKLVDDLESSAMAAALKEIRHKLAEYNLISDVDVA